MATLRLASEFAWRMTAEMRGSAILVLLTVSVGLSGCFLAVKKVLNGDAKPVDQSQVITFQPLSIPPDYALIPDTPAPSQSAAQSVSAQGQTAVPPAPGESQPADQSASAQTQTSLSTTDSTGNLPANPSPDLSAGEQAFLDAAGADNANPDIRQMLSTDSSDSEAANKSLTDELILGNPTQQNDASSGKSGSPSSATPTITRSQPSPLSGIFN